MEGNQGSPQMTQATPLEYKKKQLNSNMFDQ